MNTQTETQNKNLDLAKRVLTVLTLLFIFLVGIDLAFSPTLVGIFFS